MALESAGPSASTRVETRSAVRRASDAAPTRPTGSSLLPGSASRMAAIDASIDDDPDFSVSLSLDALRLAAGSTEPADLPTGRPASPTEDSDPALPGARHVAASSAHGRARGVADAYRAVQRAALGTHVRTVA